MKPAISILLIALAVSPLGGCSGWDSLPSLGAPMARAPAAAPDSPEAPNLGAFLGGAVGAGLSDADKQTAYQAQLDALQSGQRRSWRGGHGVFGYVEPEGAEGTGCRGYAHTIYVAGRPRQGHGQGCPQPDGAWRIVS